MRTAVLVALNSVVFMAGYASVSKTVDGRPDFPVRPIKLIVPFGAGGGTDTFARIFDKAIRDESLLPVPLVIVNLDGAGGTIGSQRLKDARPDGHTIMVLHEAILTAKAAGTVNYGPEAFEPIAATGEITTTLTVPHDSPYQSLPELLDAVTAEPNTVRFAANIGALTHFVGLQLEALKPGAEFRFAQFGGGADRLAALVGGHADVTGFTMEEFLKFQPKGLRALASFGEQRHPAAPDVPTAIEQGIQYTNSNTFYWWAPSGTPRGRVEFIAEMLGKAMVTEYVAGRMADTNMNPLFLRDAELRERIRTAEDNISRIAIRPTTELPDIPWIVMGSLVALLGGCVIERRVARSGSRGSPGAEVTEASRSSSLDQPNSVLTSKRHHSNVASRRTLAIVALTVAYAMLLSSGAASFTLTTILFVFLAVSILDTWSPRRMPASLLLAQTVGFGLNFVFTQLLVIDLP